MSKYTGLFHLHTSDFSFDGQTTLESAVAQAKKCGHSFLLLAEHGERRDEADCERMEKMCQTLSDNSFLVVPGIEVRAVQGIHIATLGAAVIVEESEPAALLDRAQEKGLFSVLLHISQLGWESVPEWVSKLDAVEVWNARHDGQRAPDPSAVRLYQKIRQVSPSAVGMAGMDAHYIWEVRKPGLAIEAKELTWKALSHSLSHGGFTIDHNRFPLKPDFLLGSPSAVYTIHYLHRWFRHLADLCRRPR